MHRASPHLAPLRDCPHCRSALRIPEDTDARRCAGCGLVWRELPRQGWLPLPDEAVAGATGLPLSTGSVGFSLWSLFGIALFAGCACCGLSPLLLLGALIDRAVCGSDVGFGSWMVLAIIVPLGLWVGVPAAGGVLSILVQVFLPERITAEGDELRLRLRRGWIRRTDVRLPRAALGEVLLRAWQLGTREVWVVHRAGAALHVSGAASGAEAEGFGARLAGWIAGRID